MATEEWSWSQWGELGVLEYGRALRGYRESTGSVRVFGTNGPIGWTDEEQGPGPTVVVGRKGAYRGVNYSPGPFWVIDTAFWLRPLVEMDMRWAYYQLLTQDINGRDSGSAIPSLSRSDFSTLEVAVPPIREQRAIAAVLGAIDDKIESNMLVRSTARKLAMSLFQKAQGMGVERLAVGHLTTSIARGVAPKYSDVGQGVPVINQKCIRDGWVTLSAARWMHPVDAAPSRVAKFDDILVNSTGVGTLGRVARWLGKQKMHVDGHVTILHPDSSKCDPVIFGYAMLASQPELEALGEGSTGQTELGRERLASLVVDIPTPENCEVVSPQLSLLDRVAGQLYEETQYLLALREALLPTLISGELRVNDTKALVEEPA